MPLISLRDIQVSFGGPPLLDGVNLSMESGERVCLLGRNGTGKSTLMKLVAGEIPADDGELSLRQGIRISRVAQEVPETTGGSVFEAVSGGLGRIGELVRAYHDASLRLASEGSDAAMGELARVQQQLEAADGWQTEQRVETVISRLSLEPDAAFRELSGGLKRRVLLARALVQAPDLLLLDEPTNHLDIASIDWLEEFLLGCGITLLFVTHDRTFLRRLATRIVELDRGWLNDWPGDYDNYLRRRAERLDAEERANARFDKKLAQEEVWIRQGIKARRTRNEGRVRALKAMREERRMRREQSGRARMALQEAERSGKLVIETEDLGYGWDGRPVVEGLSTTILRGDRIGIIGPNGAGKTTLLNLLLGKLSPDRGSVRLGTRLELAYFDQMRTALDPESTVQESLGDGGDSVTVNGVRKHVISYLQEFLFTPDRIRQPVRALSGGERNRLLLARLFTRPANLLVMDEPTNDLDVETLELLEELLLQYQGTLLLVSHDRAFLDNVVTSTLVLEGEGRVGEYVGGYEDWQRQREVERVPAAVERRRQSVKREKPVRPAITKLGYREQRELESLPARIEQLEADLTLLQGTMADPAFYKQQADQISSSKARLTAMEKELAEAYQRWEQLESQREGAGD